jgi:uncharacterized protein
MTILLHTSKTMRPASKLNFAGSEPELIKRAQGLAAYVQGLNNDQIADCMRISPKKAESVKEIFAQWSVKGTGPAADMFLGDIYSGLQVQTWSSEDWHYAQDHLRIFSGLYGVLRPIDNISPYRLEMGYKLPGKPFNNLYTFWGDTISHALPPSVKVINLAAAEYWKASNAYLKDKNVVSPKFLTVNATTHEPTFVVVHAKIARGAFAKWLIQSRADDTVDVTEFNELGYTYVSKLSTEQEPVFVCKEFKGIGLSVRLT